MGLPRQEYWNGLPFPSPGDLSHPEIKPVSPALAGRFFTAEPRGKCKLPVGILYILFSILYQLNKRKCCEGYKHIRGMLSL